MGDFIGILFINLSINTHVEIKAEYKEINAINVVYINVFNILINHLYSYPYFFI